MNLIIRILVYPHMRRSAESSSCRASLSFQKKKPPLHSPVAARISDRAFSISAGSADQNKEVIRWEKKQSRSTVYVTTLTVLTAAEAVSSGRTGKLGALSGKRIAITWRNLRKSDLLVTGAVTGLVSVSA